MIGLDSNVVVRYHVQDDASQAAAATRLMERSLSAENPGFVTSMTLCESVWLALRDWRASPADLGDALIGRRTLAQGGEKTMTFDRGAAGLPGFELLR